MDNVGNVLDESPAKLANSILLFCKGLGWLTSVDLPGVERRSSTGSNVSTHTQYQHTKRFIKPYQGHWWWKGLIGNRRGFDLERNDGCRRKHKAVEICNTNCFWLGLPDWMFNLLCVHNNWARKRAKYFSSKTIYHWFIAQLISSCGLQGPRRQRSISMEDYDKPNIRRLSVSSKE